MAEVVWSWSKSNGSYLLSVAPAGAIYRSVTKPHIQALQRVIDTLASQRVNELENYYTAVQDQEAERVAAGKYRDSMDKLWTKKLTENEYILLKRGKGDGKLSAKLYITYKENPSQASMACSFLSKGFAGGNQIAQAQIGQNHFEELAPATATGDTTVDFDFVCAGDFRDFMFAKNSTTSQKFTVPIDGPMAPIKLTSILGREDEFAARARFSRELMRKTTVPLRVHTTLSGALKRKSMDDDQDPYGGSAKQWEYDGANVSLNEHIREFNATISAIASGLKTSGPSASSRVIMVFFQHMDGAFELRYENTKNGRAMWRGQISKLNMTYEASLFFEKLTGSWTIQFVKRDAGAQIQEQRTLAALINELAWSPDKQPFLSGAPFEQGAYAYIGAPETMWLQTDANACWRFNKVEPRRLEARTGFYLKLDFTAQVDCNTDVCYARVYFHDTQTIKLIDHKKLCFEVSQSCRLYQDVISQNEDASVAINKSLFSAYPFQEQNDPADKFVDDLVKKCGIALMNLHNQPPSSTREFKTSNSNHVLDNMCYQLVQAPEQGTDAPVIQMSNGEDKWAIGANATISADAMVACLIYAKAVFDNTA